MLGHSRAVSHLQKTCDQRQRQRFQQGCRRWTRCSSRSSSSAGASNITSVCAKPSMSDQADLVQHCQILKAGATLCNAEITALPGGARGMVAKQLILPGHSVLECAAANILAVPKTTAAVDHWHSWLQLYTSAHGPLPQQLLDFLADTTASPTVRLASWLLHLRACCSDSSTTNTSTPSSTNTSTCACAEPRSFWCSYIALLQACGPMTAVCSGAWGQWELQQLEPPALRGWVGRHHVDARKASLAAYTLLAAGQHPVAQLGLASSSERQRAAVCVQQHVRRPAECPWCADMGWAVALVKTRAHGDANRLALMPLHDMINHRERGSANCAPATPGAASVDGGYTLAAAATIQPGEEVTNAYTAPLSNAQMLLGWGFSQPAKAGDWLLAVPLQYGCCR
ncbi:hypothetical protein COO60DRAFT_860171 [Scenedesmus sp. NREL 46B-D3]|nr:hypothetical protein COO60DRAFT_860171 [Scenedesmus sp. NREL 46B-D3]